MKALKASAALILIACFARGQQKNAGGDWPTYGLTPGETRYSPLTQIDTTNVKRLGLAWSYDISPGGGGQEATPLVFNGVTRGGRW